MFMLLLLFRCAMKFKGAVKHGLFGRLIKVLKQLQKRNPVMHNILHVLAFSSQFMYEWCCMRFCSAFVSQTLISAFQEPGRIQRADAQDRTARVEPASGVKSSRLARKNPVDVSASMSEHLDSVETPFLLMLLDCHMQARDAPNSKCVLVESWRLSAADGQRRERSK